MLTGVRAYFSQSGAILSGSPYDNEYHAYLQRCVVTLPTKGERSIVMSVSVCLCVCLSAIISSELNVRSSPISVRVTCGHGSVLLGRCGDTLCTTSGFIEDVMFAHKPRLLDVAAQPKRSAHAALGLAINYAHTSCRPTD